MADRNTRFGFVLFFIYLAFYGGFVLLNAFYPETMERTPVAGMNLAILYGFGLIIVAFVLALIYGAVCRLSKTPSKEE
jgi:uncharacterized membrane protein (DUF485 family)